MKARIKKFLLSLGYLVALPIIMVMLTILGTILLVISIIVFVISCPLSIAAVILLGLADILTLGQFSICKKIFDMSNFIE